MGVVSSACYLEVELTPDVVDAKETHNGEGIAKQAIDQLKHSRLLSTQTPPSAQQFIYRTFAAPFIVECAFMRTTKRAADCSGTRGTAPAVGGPETERLLEGETDSTGTIYHQMSSSNAVLTVSAPEGAGESERAWNVAVARMQPQYHIA